MEDTGKNRQNEVEIDRERENERQTDRQRQETIDEGPASISLHSGRGYRPMSQSPERSTGLFVLNWYR